MLGGAHARPSVFLEELTWPQVEQRVHEGATTILVPLGGTEQNGPYMVLGKHNTRARLLAQRIAERLGNTLVAPVVSYVPEGSIDPPSAHMRFAGTISIPETAFAGLLEGAARSFKRHGFRNVYFLGDHGGYQSIEESVARKLDREWAADPSCRVHALTEYYRVTETAYVDALKHEGYSEAEIGSHAGLADTSLSLALDPDLVRDKELRTAAAPTVREGVHGDPRRASAQLGREGVQLIVDASVAAIEAANATTSARPPRQPSHSLSTR